MQLLSKCSPLFFSGGTEAPRNVSSSRMLAIVKTFSAISLEALKRRERCWFIFARGAFSFITQWNDNNGSWQLNGSIWNPYHSINSHVQQSSWSNNRKHSVNAFKNCNHHLIFILGGRSVKGDSVTWNEDSNSCQDIYLSSGCVHGWMMPFISKYRLSNSIPFGLGFDTSTGKFLPSWSCLGCKYIYWTCYIIPIFFWYTNLTQMNRCLPFLRCSRKLQTDTFVSTTWKMLELPFWLNTTCVGMLLPTM